MSCGLRLFGLCTLGILPVATAVAQIPPGYEVVQVTNDPAPDFGVRINNRGQLVYESRVDGTVESGEIFLWEDGKATRLTHDNVRDAHADINDDGVIVWSRYDGPPGQFGPTAELMMRFADGIVIQLTDNDMDDIGASLNEQGHVAFTRLMGSGCSGAVMDIFLFDGGGIRPITNNAIPEGLANQTPRLNDLGQIVWTEFDFCLNPWDSEVMLWDKGITMRLTSTQFEPRGPDINNRGVVAWSHNLFGTTGTDIWEAGVTRRLTDWGGGTRLNDLGMVAIARWHEATGLWQQWLYRDNRFWQLSNDPFWNFDGHINNLGEVAWVAGTPPRMDIRYLRRSRPGDVNCDGNVDGFDIEPFILALTDIEGYTSMYPSCDPLLADVNGDQTVDAFDIEPFITILNP